ncbi:TorF family putative porin [Hydrogenovibrio kuenenii]|uniref:TorF family putative porin n=1 Tax=Hydrogenovibrio kuenenii TaxID=63658 RepID=UPI0004660AB2|nr:TorF family putative porin [Hydrogenovibrio kuenenii]
MKKIAQLKSLVMAMAVAGSTVAALTPATSQADVSYSAGVSNMYLWRGINISNPAPTVSGSIDWSNDMFYAGTWTSSEGKFDGSSEWDLYAGYTPKIGDFGFTLGYNAYLYPYANKDMFKYVKTGTNGSMLGDYVLGMAYKDLSLTVYLDARGKDSDNNKYITADYSIGKFGLHAGINKNDKSAAEYTEFNVSYAATDKLTFTLSKAQGDGAKAIAKTVSANGSGTGAEGENPQLQVSYSFM